MNPLASMMNNGPQNPIANILQMLKSGDPNQIAARLMQSNPQFKQFVEANKGKTPEQVASEHGVNLSQIMGGFK